jgi:hypothetical protein
MAVALAYPEPEKGGRGQKSFILKGFAESNLSYARTVIKHTPDMVKIIKDKNVFYSLESNLTGAFFFPPPAHLVFNPRLARNALQAAFIRNE